MLDVIFNGVFGSNLYGLATPTSDMDAKGIYMPTRTELIFNDYKESIEKQTDDLDTTMYSINKFVKILEKCDTVSLDMIHTPDEFTSSDSKVWRKIRSYRSDVYCKNMRGVLGYCKSQSAKYTNKVDRLEELEDFLLDVSALGGDTRLSNTRLPELINIMEYKYISYTETRNDVKGYIDVCGSRYQLSSAIKYLRIGIESKISKYGNRTKLGSLNGGDWKSLSHAYRVMVQLDEIVTKRDLVFPLTERNTIMSVKNGEFEQSKVMGMIDDAYDIVTEKLQNSDLPDYPNMKRIKEAVVEYYG